MIETRQVGTPGWWLKRLFLMIQDPRRQRRLAVLRQYRDGEPPVPQGAEAMRDTYEAFVKKARLNLAELVVTALSDRLQPVGFQTGQDDDATGDEEVGKMWKRASMAITAADVHDMVLTYGEAYAIVGPRSERTGAPVVTPEDPRWIIGDPDPVDPRFLNAALKVVYDDIAQEDRAYLYLPGGIFVARRPGSTTVAPIAFPEQRGPTFAFDENTWMWDQERSGPVQHRLIPVVRFRNLDGKGEFETHIDTLERINHQILQTMVIATMQAFRVRALKGAPRFDPENPTKEIDYSAILTLDPGSVWMLPPDVDLWESGTTDLTPLLSAIKDDLTRLSAATKTPMHMLQPEGANQSAEGASLQREGLVFKAEDRIERLRPQWAQVASLMLHVMGDIGRADLGSLYTMFAPPERLSLSERADAASKLAPFLSNKTMLTKVIQMSPAEAERNLSEKEDDLVLQAQLIAAQAQAGGPQPAGATAPGQPGGNQQAGGQRAQPPQQQGATR